MRHLETLLKRCTALSTCTTLRQTEIDLILGSCSTLNSAWGGNWHTPEHTHTHFQKQTDAVRWLQEITNKVFRPVQSVFCGISTEIHKNVLYCKPPTYAMLMQYGTKSTQIQPACSLLQEFFAGVKCNTLLKAKITRQTSWEFASIVFHLNVLKTLTKLRTSHEALHNANKFNFLLHHKLGAQI